LAVMIADYLRPRTDNTLAGRAKSILAQSKIPAIRLIEAEEDSDGIALRGQVPLYYYKQLAQELVRSELEEIAIFNEIKVVDPH